MELMLGVDAGGTGSRAVVLDTAGELVGRGDGGPGNPCVTGADAVRSIGATIRAALGEHDPATVRGAVVGIAGLSSLADPLVREAFAHEWAAIGLTCAVPVVGDAVTAFAAGTDGATQRGSVLIAGTGAVAALVDGLDVVRTADGLGWLLGDEGSGVWVGLEAVRSAARRRSELGAAVMAFSGTRTPDELVAWAHRQTPNAFAALAPLVCAGTDAEATRIAAAAVDRLLATLAELDTPGDPVVLAGGLLTADTPIRRGILAGLGDRGRVAGDPALGAARLALHRAAEAGEEHGAAPPA